MILRTGGWFYLGFPFILGIAMACAFAVTLVARSTSRIWVWVTILPLSVVLAYAGGTRDFPAHRLPAILGIDPTATNVIGYRVIDSFNDGDMIVGTLNISPAEFASIVKNRDLSPQSDMSRPALAQDRYPDGLPTAWNEQLTVWYDAVDRRLFFRYHNRQKPRRSTGLITTRRQSPPATGTTCLPPRRVVSSGLRLRCAVARLPWRPM